ncbi:MAG: tetratricopeptide repeat protein [Tenuifilaceae bacterium]|jgi:signal transduction histidine kinase/predicted RNA-binding protein YlqC (UPF0109 family)|nr:tetratricopeptide repeat protein [Tenuifilaceae bacterium]
MQVQRLNLFIIVTFFALGSAVASNQKSGNYHKTNDQAFRYLNENPRKALSIAQQGVSQAKLDSDTTTLVQGFALLSRIYSTIGKSDSAALYIDSALVYNQFQHTPNLEIIRAQISFLNRNNKTTDSNALIDNALRKSKSKNNDTATIGLLLLQSDNLRTSQQPSQAIEFAISAIELANKKKDQNSIGIAHRALGSIYFQQGQFALSLEEYLKAESAFALQSDTMNIIITLRNISLAQRDLGDYNAAFSTLHKALDLANIAGDVDEMGHIYNLLGSLYARTGKPTIALENYNRSLQIRKEFELLSSYASTLENISRIQRDLGNYIEALSNLELTLAIRKELDDAQRLGSTYNEMGNLFAQQGNLAEALKSYLNSLKIRQEANLQTDIARSLVNIGITYRQLNSHHNALKYFNQALGIITDSSDPVGKSYIYIHIGNSLRDMGNAKEAVENYAKALNLRKNTGNQILIAQAMRSIAVAYNETDDFQKAHQHLDQAIIIAKSLNDEGLVADLLNEKGNVLQRQGKLLEAISYFDQASILFGKIFDLDKRGLCLRKIGELQTKLGHFNSAFDNLKLALSLSEKTQNKKLKELTLLALHNFYSSRGQYMEALTYFKQYIAIKDSLVAITRMENILQASLDVELNKKAEEIKLIESEVESLRTEAQLREIQLKQQKLIKNFLAISSIFVLVVALGSIYGYVVIRKKNLRLNEAYEKITLSESELKKMVQTKDKLFSIIAHDLRSPFTALVGLTEVLANQSNDLSKPDINEYSKLINESSEKLLKLIENLLEWSRSQTDKILLSPKPINLYSLVNDSISVLMLQANAKEIKVDNLVPKDLIVMADYETMTTVIRNLTSNAIKFTTKGGTVKLAAEVDPGFISIRIADTGVGISPENQAKLFKLDESFSTKGTGQEAGTGLGLIICKEFVEKNQGTISVTSSQGKGTIFTIKLHKG